MWRLLMDLVFGLCLFFFAMSSFLPTSHKDGAKEINRRTLKAAATIDHLHRRHNAIGPSPSGYFSGDHP